MNGRERVRRAVTFGHPAEDARAMGYEPPWELVEAGCEEIDATLRANHERFALAGCVRLFERLQWLRGMERLMLDMSSANGGIVATLGCRDYADD